MAPANPPLQTRPQCRVGSVPRVSGLTGIRSTTIGPWCVWRGLSITLTALSLFSAPELTGQVSPHPLLVASPVSRSARAFHSISEVRALLNGDVFVLDALDARVTLLDSGLDVVRVVASVNPAEPAANLAAVAGMLPWAGDTTVLVSADGPRLMLVDADGRIGRSVRTPSSVPPLCLVGNRSRAVPSRRAATVVCMAPPETSRRDSVAHLGVNVPLHNIADSVALVRVDLSSGGLDVVAHLRSPKTRDEFVANERCDYFITPLINPVPIVDDWAVTDSGSVVVVRSNGTLEWFDAREGTLSSTHPEFAARSVSTQSRDYYAKSFRRVLADARRAATRPPAEAGSTRAAATCTLRPKSINMVRIDLAEDPVRLAAIVSPIELPLAFLPVSELPDSVPGFESGDMRIDHSGLVWIRLHTATDSTSVYEVLDKGGRLVSRVAVGMGRRVLGFGSGDLVYLAERGLDGVHLEEANVPLREVQPRGVRTRNPLI